MKMTYLIILISLLLFITISFYVIKLIRKKQNKKLTEEINQLEIKKNNLESLPIMIEINKIEEIAKSEQLENKINYFKQEYN